MRQLLLLLRLFNFGAKLAPKKAAAAIAAAPAVVMAV